jgi:hypothetical protein
MGLIYFLVVRHLSWQEAREMGAGMRIIFLGTLFFSSMALAQISKTDLEVVSKALHVAYDQELHAKGQKFVLNPEAGPNFKDFWWNLDDIRAAYSGLHEDGIIIHYIYLFGGYARLDGISRDGVAATLCHELGHGIGGNPYKLDPYDKDGRVSVEGQADDYAFRYCLKRVFKFLPPTQVVRPLNSLTEGLCKKRPAADYQFCTRAFQTLESERRFFRLSPTEPETYYDRPDLSKVEVVNQDMEFYPSTQCRLDTMMNGILGQPRPTCWFR